MILDQLSRLALYTHCHADILRIKTWLETNDIHALPNGKHDLSNGLSCGLSEYTTRPLEACKTECHRAHIDLQIILSGSERIGYAPIENCTPITEFDSTKDVMFLKGTVELFTLVVGNFTLLFPHDVHTPGIHPANEETKVRKAVFKLPC